MKNKKKLIMILVVLIAVIGILITATVGLNVDLKYQASQKLNYILKKNLKFQIYNQ